MKYEAHSWIALNILLMDPECRRKYRITSFRKETILRVIEYNLLNTKFIR